MNAEKSMYIVPVQCTLYIVQAMNEAPGLKIATQYTVHSTYYIAKAVRTVV